MVLRTAEPLLAPDLPGAVPDVVFPTAIEPVEEFGSTDFDVSMAWLTHNWLRDSIGRCPRLDGLSSVVADDLIAPS